MKSFRALSYKNRTDVVIKNIITGDNLKLKPDIKIYLGVTLRFINVSNSGHDIYLQLELLAKTKNDKGAVWPENNLISLRGDEVFPVIPNDITGPCLRDILETISMPYSVLNLNKLLQEEVAQKMADFCVLHIKPANEITNVLLSKVTKFKKYRNVIFTLEITDAKKKFTVKQKLKSCKNILSLRT
ncbi:hypothetical protein ACFLY5_00345 [Patescibacteria group bacterium]